MPSWNQTTSSATRCTPVADAVALTAPASLGAAYTQTEVNALRVDVAACQAKINALLAALRSGGIV